MPSPALILIAVIALSMLIIVSLMFRSLHIAASLVEQHSLDRQRTRPAAAPAPASPAAAVPARRGRHRGRWILTAAAVTALALWLLASNSNAAVGTIGVIAAVLVAAALILLRVYRKPRAAA